jgi:hypothetical protein
MKIRLGLLVAILLLVSHTALPEIEKVGRVCGNGICPAWWPKLEPVKGSHHEDEAGCPGSRRVSRPGSAKSVTGLVCL